MRRQKVDTGLQRAQTTVVSAGRQSLPPTGPRSVRHPGVSDSIAARRACRGARILRRVGMRRPVLLVLGLAMLSGVRVARAQAPEQDLVVRQLAFRCNRSLNELLLQSSIATTNSGWLARHWPFRAFGMGEKRYFDETDFQRDVLRLEVLYKKSGFPDVRIDTLVRRTPRDIYITFVITEGRPVVVDTLAVTGLDSVPAELRRAVLVDLPLQQGDVFNRFLMQTSADTIARRLQDRGYPMADVLVSYEVRRGAYHASVTLDAIPGRSAVVGPVRVEGARRVDSATVVNLMVARPGEPFSLRDLFESQRNLYGSDVFRLASVDVDSTRWVPGADSVPLVVTVAEAAPRSARSGVGYGTNDCLRGSAGLTFRDFFGAGRLLDLSAHVSKVGIGAPTDWGFEHTVLCAPLRDDSIGSRLLNYNATASLRRPAFLSPNNTLVLSGYAERRSEFKVYRRTEVGVSVGITRESPIHRLPLALTYNLSYGRTDASPFSFCAFFNACRPEDAAPLEERRPLATLTATAAIPRANNPLDPSRGYVASAAVTTASRYLGSSS